jgi:signal transduction histidine kinase
VRRGLFVPLLLLVVLPTAALAVVGWRVVSSESRLLRAEVDQVLTLRLRDLRGRIEELLRQREATLGALVAMPAVDVATLRQRGEGSPLLDQVFALDAAGELVYPRVEGPLSERERAFLRRTEQLWTARDSFVKPVEGSAAARASGWYTWYWENGLGLLYWKKLPGGEIAGAELNRARLLADVLALLPVPRPQSTPEAGCFALLDARGQPVYAWGASCGAGELALARTELALAPPLAGWKLAVLVAPPGLAELGTRRLAVGVALGLLAVLLAVGLSAAYLYRESTRETREAKEKVSFVNQVSHELKTPLTNIRMYAEMLANDLPEEEKQAHRRLAVVVSECQRLSRLIGNVLTFARRERNELKLRRAPAVLDQVMADVVAQFAPALEQKGVTVFVDAHTPERRSLDADAVSQVLANLFANVEKYAAGGKALRVSSRREGGQLEVIVADDGPGIPSEARERIFLPFVRLSNSVTDGVAGTGIGLAIARELARLHGGDLVLVPSERGARFRFTLTAPEVP